MSAKANQIEAKKSIKDSETKATIKNIRMPNITLEFLENFSFFSSKSSRFNLQKKIISVMKQLSIIISIVNSRTPNTPVNARNKDRQLLNYTGFFTQMLYLKLPIMVFRILIDTDETKNTLAMHCFSLYSLCPSLLSF